MSRFFAMEERELERIIALHNDLIKVKAETERKDIQEITAIIKSETQNMGDLFEIKDGVAHIPIIGELSEKPSLSAALFGADQTTFGSIIDNINKAMDFPMVEKIIFEIDSPGGTVDGTDQTAMAIRAIDKPTEAHIHNMAASAAFWLAAQTDKIVALNPVVEVGSIGVAVEIFDDSEADKKAGIKIHTIVSSGAEDKRPDVATKGGRDKIKERWKEIDEVFVQRIAEGRGVSEETVREDFGKGSVLIASKALEAGMIDAIMDGGQLIQAKGHKNDKKHKAEIDKVPATVAGNNNEEVIKMTIDELKVQDPDLYKKVFEAGVEQERDRVQAHLTLGKQSGAMEAAVKHIEDGDGMTQTITAEYMAAGMNKADVDKREDDAVPDLPLKVVDTPDEIVKDTVAAVAKLRKGA